MMKTTHARFGLMLGLVLLGAQFNFMQVHASVFSGGSPDSAHPTLELWLDAGTIPVGTTSVSNWPDLSADMRDAVQATAVSRPTYTSSNPLFVGRPTVHFDGGGFVTTGTSLAMNIDGAKSRTIFFVFSQDAALPRNIFGYGLNAGLQLFDVAAAHQKISGHFYGTPFIRGTQTFAVNQMTVGTVRYDGSTFQTFQHDMSVNALTSSTGYSLNTGNSPFNIGRGVYSVYNNFNGDIAEILVYSEALSDTDRIAVEEYLFSKYTNPIVTDTDGDGISDDDETSIYGTDPNDADSDDDGLNDGDELGAGTNPLNPDSDGDGLSDGSDPDPNTFNDVDGDGLGDGMEVSLGTDPLNPDSDGDGLLDGTEVDPATGTDPLNPDSDGDGVSDGDEVNGSGTNPNNPDSDGDGVGDAEDPLPNDPGVTSGYTEDWLRMISGDALAYDLSLIDAKNNNAAKGRRNALSNKLNSAANTISTGNYEDALESLTSLLQKLDDVDSPKDWMLPSPEKTQLRSDVEQLIYLIGLL